MPERVFESEKREDDDQIGTYCLQDQNKDDDESIDGEGTEKNMEKCINYILNLFYLTYSCLPNSTL